MSPTVKSQVQIAAGPSLTATSASAVNGDAAGDGSPGGSNDVGFERSCSWEPSEKPCWIMSDLDVWNRILSRNCIELHEHMWGELTLQGYPGPESLPKHRDVLSASFLIHLLLRQHRCVTHINLDMTIVMLERRVLWHALRTSAVGVKLLDLKPSFLNLRCPVYSPKKSAWPRAIVGLTNLHHLCLSSVYFCAVIARTLGSYVEQATALHTLLFIDVRATDTQAAMFLEHLSRNRSVKVLCLQEAFLTARHGHALADVVLKHVTLRDLKVTGTLACTPSALLDVAVRSPSLTSLSVHTCLVRAVDIEVMAAALTMRTPSSKCGGDVAPGAPTLPMSGLESVTFCECVGSGPRLEQAYADLIGGVLVKLTLYKCWLGEAFAVAAAANLLLDARLQELNLEDNDFSITDVYNMIATLEVNKTLVTLVVNLTGAPPRNEVSLLFRLISTIDVSSRLKFIWINPRGSDFAEGVLRSQRSSTTRSLDECGSKDAMEFLDALATTRNIGVAWLECTISAEQIVIQKLIDTLARTKYLRHLLLRIYLTDADVASLFRSLEVNRSIAVLEIRCVTFRKRTAMALGRLVERNRSIAMFTIDLRESDVDRETQVRHICRELKNVIRRNRFVVSFSLPTEERECSNDPFVREALRHNVMLVNQAVRFVNGSLEKTDALAFEILHNCLSVQSSLRVNFNISNEAALGKIVEARERLTFNYFILAGVVKNKIVCRPHRKGKTTFDKLGKDMQARICSYLCLNDVMDI
ncbi:uncharacterized protein [Dermacentor albipictus]|uniref:uncharacterized protein isoform X3 n=1 Tax=Dermacentor albipictus TaxID=60249 RepID=UPI0038FC1C10